ncbi:prephenate dehydratase [Nitrososphaera sp.]|uniref:prephenate dehydratase n=1 Tax=Nitrososphaera sp. TaxID=1971748 RepID=UPI002EDA71E0
MAARVAFQGERGAYGEMAALQYFPGAILMPLKSFADVFEAAERKKVAYAVIPVENSIEGSVGEVYDLLLLTKLKAVGEVYHRVHHCLIANRGVKISEIKSVYSHPQALGQCRGYLRRKKLEPLMAYDTAGAVKMIKDQKLKGAAAIASRRAAELYGMEVLAEGIEDRKNNYTRFLVLAPGADRRVGKDYKTSIMFSVKHVPGALFGILGEFALRRLNLTKIESRPTKETPWEYNFYVDFEGHQGNRAVKQVLSAVRSKTSYLKVLGSYKKASF